MESNIFDDILQNIAHIQHITNDACNIVLLGDLNSRIGQHYDYVADDFATHIDAIPDDYIPDQTLPRKSQDQVTNQNGQLLLDFFKTNWASCGK